jgi:large subunit ribosomal protein L9
MKIILHREVDKLGALGDVVDVADGYARNYLIPQGMAAPAAKGAVRHAERLRHAHHERVQKELRHARELAERMSATPIRVRARAGEDGRLFGSITVADVTDALQSRVEATIDRKQVHLAEPIRSVGTHEVTVHLHPEVNATIVVEVLPQ